MGPHPWVLRPPPLEFRVRGSRWVVLRASSAAHSHWSHAQSVCGVCVRARCGSPHFWQASQSKFENPSRKALPARLSLSLFQTVFDLGTHASTQDTFPIFLSNGDSTRSIGTSGDWPDWPVSDRFDRLQWIPWAWEWQRGHHWESWVGLHGDGWRNCAHSQINGGELL